MKINKPTFLRFVCFAALGSSTWAKKHNVTKTITVTKTKAPKTTTLTAIASDASIIDGDLNNLGFSADTLADFVVITSGTSTETALTLTPTTTVYATPLTTVTISEEAFGEFQPIRSTLPDGAYHYQLDTEPNPFDPVKRDQGAVALVARKKPTDDCVTSTKTKTKTVKGSPSATTVTTTLTGTVITWANEGVTSQWDEWTANVVYVTTTTTSTEALTTEFPVVTGTLTSTSTITTTNVYQACATENFADAIVQPDGSYLPITGLELKAVTDRTDAKSAYECCSNAWGPQNPTGTVFVWNSTGCYYSLDQGLCGEENNILNITAYTGDTSSTPAIVGNLRCGAVVDSTPQP